MWLSLYPQMVTIVRRTSENLGWQLHILEQDSEKQKDKESDPKDKDEVWDSMTL